MFENGIDLDNLTHLHKLYVFGFELIDWIHYTDKPIYQNMNCELTIKNIYETLNTLMDI